MLMAAGYRPFREIFASQGPLSLDIFYPDLHAVRADARGGPAGPGAVLGGRACVVGGLDGAAAPAGWLRGRRGRPAADVSPIFLKNSRLALVEVPALVPAIAAVGAALAYGRTGDRRWLAGAGVLDGARARDQADGRAGPAPDRPGRSCCAGRGCASG